jgi:glycogen operon protein
MERGGYRFADPDGPPNEADNAPCMPKSIVINPAFDWGNDCHPCTPWHESVIYEVHVKGFMRLGSAMGQGARHYGLAS